MAPVQTAQNHKGWKRPLRTPTCVPECRISTVLDHLQEFFWWGFCWVLVGFFFDNLEIGEAWNGEVAPLRRK